MATLGYDAKHHDFVVCGYQSTALTCFTNNAKDYTQEVYTVGSGSVHTPLRTLLGQRKVTLSNM